MRILHVYSGNLYGGVETILLAIAQHGALCPRMDSQFALCFEGRLTRELRHLGIDPVFLSEPKVSKPLTVWRARKELGLEIGGLKPDVVICHSAWAQALFAPVAREAGVKQIFWLHDAAEGRHWLERWAKLSPPDGAICNSLYTQATLMRLFPGVPTRTIYCPVSPPALPARAALRLKMRKELGIAPESVVLIQASRLEKWKGQRTHLYVLARLAEKPGLPPWISLIAGGPQRDHEKAYFEDLQALARALGLESRVKFLGQRSDVPALLAASDIHFQPNEGPEPFGIAFIEALYAGIPVLTTSLGGAAEIVTPECGVLAPQGELEFLVSELAELVSNPGKRARLGANGPERARELCDPEVQLKRLLDFASSLRSE